MSDMTDPSGQMPRRPRVSDGGAPVSGALAIVLALVAVVAGYLILNSISDGGESDLDFGSSGSVVDGGTDGSESSVPDGSSTTTTTSTTVPAIVTEGASVVVANANNVNGSAGQMKRALETGPGFTVVAAVNAAPSVGELADSVINYNASNPAAQPVAESLSEVLGGVGTVAPLGDSIPTADGDMQGADVILLLGNDLAGKTLEEINPSLDQTTQATSPEVAATTTTLAG
jgi:hypothetical protein